MKLVTYRDSGGAESVGEIDGDNIQPLAAESMIDWLKGNGREANGDPVVASDVELLAPVPVPPSIRDFFTYKVHVETVTKPAGGIPEYWHEGPVFYFTNPSVVHAPGEPVARPSNSVDFDFELEIAAVMDGNGEIAGFTLYNDWSARDIQRNEMPVGVGHPPGAGGHLAVEPAAQHALRHLLQPPLGPGLVTPRTTSSR